ncbi:hypothetical protein UA08_00114 [Talaromyces atroroseus]|uniref:Uncharacterized protein n=1 Tax=Talaromyces atroroseus TaxID=1441469 RepID=A0A225BCF9_TALAT|nr:hypothetical protein UA08_00114 [Talaromyces atroroseus]OKL64605.1 hypothetical protein UA08_00114 [Talaromyces atroroseus]
MGNSSTSIENIKAFSPKTRPPSKKKYTEKASFAVRKRWMELLSALPEEYFQRNHELQVKSSFWNALETLRPEEHDAADKFEHITMNEKEWSRYAVRACVIYIECGLLDEQILSILNQTIAYVAVCALRAGHRRVYFDDGINVFFDPCDSGMAYSSRQKYEILLERLRGLKSVENKRSVTLAVSGDGHEQKPAAAAVAQATPASTTVTQPLKIPSSQPFLNENQIQHQKNKPKKRRSKKKSKGLQERDHSETKTLKRRLFDDYTMGEHKKQKFSKHR